MNLYTVIGNNVLDGIDVLGMQGPYGPEYAEAMRRNRVNPTHWDDKVPSMWENADPPPENHYMKEEEWWDTNFPGAMGYFRFERIKLYVCAKIYTANGVNPWERAILGDFEHHGQKGKYKNYWFDINDFWDWDASRPFGYQKIYGDLAIGLVDVYYSALSVKEYPVGTAGMKYSFRATLNITDTPGSSWDDNLVRKALFPPDRVVFRGKWQLNGVVECCNGTPTTAYDDNGIMRVRN